MKKTFFSAAILSIILVPGGVLATGFQAGDQVYLKENLDQDIYAAGSLIELQADMNGDFFAAGEKITINGEVTEDLMLAGSQIIIDAPIRDDIRAIGEKIVISQTVGGDILAAAQDLNLGKGAVVEGDVLFAGESIFVDGVIKGALKGTGQKIHLNGTVNGDVRVYNRTTIVFGPEAKILGNLTYSGAEKMNIPDGVVAGEINFKPAKPRGDQQWEKGMGAFSVFSFLSTLFLGLLLIGFLRHGAVYNVERAEENALKNLGIGFLVLVATPIAAGIFMFTLIGLPIGFILLGLWLIAMAISKIFAGLLIGQKILKINQKSSFLRVFGSFALGTFLYLLIGLIPIFGPIFKFLVLMVALGGFFMAQRDRFKELRKKKLV